MGGSCFEQLGAAPAPSDRELHELDNFWPLHAQSPQQQLLAFFCLLAETKVLMAACCWRRVYSAA
jgi:hypothetical protein